MRKLSQFKTLAQTKRGGRRVGRGIGSGVGKTCGRGQKGAGARAGYKRRLGTEGGQVPLYRKLPTRGFSNKRFQRRLDSINLSQVEKMFKDGEVVSLTSLREHGYISGKSHGIKILADGDLTKKVTFEVDAISEAAKAKLDKAGVEYKVLS